MTLVNGDPMNRINLIAGINLEGMYSGHYSSR